MPDLDWPLYVTNILIFPPLSASRQKVYILVYSSFIKWTINICLDIITVFWIIRLTEYIWTFIVDELYYIYYECIFIMIFRLFTNILLQYIIYKPKSVWGKRHSNSIKYQRLWSDIKKAVDASCNKCIMSHFERITTW